MGFIGTQLSGKSAPGFDYGLWLVDRAGEDVKPHGHHEAHFVWAITGLYETNAEGSAEPGSDILVFNPPQTYHADRFLTAGAAFATLAIDPKLLSESDAFAAPKVPTQIASPSTRSLLRRLAQLTPAAYTLGRMDIEALFFETLGSLGADQNPARTPPRWLGQACDRLREETNLSFRDVAKGAGVHPTHLVRVFRAHMNCTPGEYARGRRIEKAAAMLSGVRLSISEIAVKLGFSDQSHLTRQFKRAFAITPADYRKAARRCLRLR